MEQNKRTFVDILNLIKLIIAFALMAGMTYAFTFYLDGDIGVVIAAFLLLAPLISRLLLSLMKPVHITVQVPAYTAKGKHFGMQLTLHSEGKLPVPFVQCRTEWTQNFTADDPRPVQSALMPGKPLELEFGMTAVYAGCGTITVPPLRVSDYLGLFHRTEKQPPRMLKVGVIPEIPSLSGAGVLLHSVSDAVMTQDEEEEESAAAFSSVSMPGYVHREYVPGDNLRRINWKLSAKRNRLMVRMDEAAATVRPTLILDLRMEQTPEALKLRETLMEGALGLLMLLVQQGIPCSLRFASDGCWKSLVPENEEAVRQAAVELATADFQNDGNRMDVSASQEKAGAFLVYTAHPDAALAQAMVPLRAKGYLYCVVPRGADTEQLSEADAVWTLAEDFTMTALQK